MLETLVDNTQTFHLRSKLLNLIGFFSSFGGAEPAVVADIEVGFES